jgi:hypothetical protein
MLWLLGASQVAMLCWTLSGCCDGQGLQLCGTFCRGHGETSQHCLPVAGGETLPLLCTGEGVSCLMPTRSADLEFACMLCAAACCATVQCGDAGGYAIWAVAEDKFWHACFLRGNGASV